MRRSIFRKAPRLETLESRQVLSTVTPPTVEQQYMLSMTNLARTNPTLAADKYAPLTSDPNFSQKVDADVVATLKYYGVDINQIHNAIASSPVRPPVAWNSTLANAANGMATDQAVNGFQSHTGSNGSNLGQRLANAGYANPTAEGENTYAYSKSVDHAMEAFLIDWGVNGAGHRNNLMQPGASDSQLYKEVGIAIVPSQNANVGPFVITQDYGTSANAPAQVVGTAFNDNTGTGTFADGEGVGGVSVTAVNNATGQVVGSASTWASGGYQIALNPGQYTLTASINGRVLQSNQLNVGNDNIEVDYNLTQLQKSTPTPSPTPVVTAAPLIGADTNSSFGESWTTWSSDN